MPFENYFFLEKASWDLFFPGEGLLRFIFFPGRPFEIYFFLGVASKIFFLSQKYFWIYFFLRRAFWDLFFLEEGLLRFIFSWGMPFEIYFFLEKGLQFFFLDFLRALPQIINGRPLRVICCQTSMKDLNWLCYNYDHLTILLTKVVHFCFWFDSGFDKQKPSFT